MAGVSVDVALFPLDTIKTRLQSQQGFQAAGGFRGIYAGLMSVTLGSAPIGAVFFCSYEVTKYGFSKVTNDRWIPAGHMLAASVGEVTGCLLRVPVEVIKQRAQTSPHLSSLAIFKSTVASEGFKGLYRGYLSTVTREIPFSLIQFPLWELFKKMWSEKTKRPIEAWQSSLCGALAGGISAAVTTPLDVAKTRIMLAEKDSRTARGNVWHVMGHVYSQQGLPGIFSGIAPRVTWISIGGAIFLGIYEKVKIVMQDLLGL
ncbi:mitochondrial S-adenosylmethionine carrier protein-like isoform X2 [Babylonia areolata]